MGVSSGMVAYQVPTMYITSTMTSTTANVVMWYAQYTVTY